jgi:hypothetical protein
LNISNPTKKVTQTYHARILSPIGVYPAESIYFEDAAYMRDDELSFSVCKYEKHTRGDDDSYSEVEWLNPAEARLYSSLMLSVDREESYSGFYPYPFMEIISSSSESLNKEWLKEYVKPYLIKKIAEPYYVINSGAYPFAKKNKYQELRDISSPPIVGGHEYDFRATGIDYEFSRTLYRSIDINDALLIRGLTTLIKAAMLRCHYQFFETAVYSLFISMEVSFRLVLRALKAKGISEPTSKDAMTYIHDAFNDLHRTEKYFEDYYNDRIRTFHPESRLGTFPHAPLAADDIFFLFNDMLKVYAFLICGHVHIKHKKKIIYSGDDGMDNRQ